MENLETLRAISIALPIGLTFGLLLGYSLFHSSGSSQRSKEDQ